MYELAQMFHHDHWTGMWYGWILWIAIAALVIYLIYKVVTMKTRVYNGSASTETPLETLKRRYAEGEISDEEFDRKKKNLEE